MPVRNRFAELHPEITAWRRDIHQNPEILYDTHRTSAVVAEKLQEFGCDEVVTGIGRTGVVGVIKGKVDTKGRNDFVSEVDRMAEDDIIQTVRRSYPDHAFLAEESGASGDAEFVWIIDPLDGTTNFLHGFPVFAVSIAVMQRGRLEHGVIYDPMRQELFTCSRGAGATVDGRKMRVFQPGPVFTNLLLADEINRTPPKTQAALLETMQELQVTAAGHTFKLDLPFFVLAMISETVSSAISSLCPSRKPFPMPRSKRAM